MNPEAGCNSYDLAYEQDELGNLMRPLYSDSKIPVSLCPASLNKIIEGILEEEPLEIKINRRKPLVDKDVVCRILAIPGISILPGLANGDQAFTPNGGFVVNSWGTPVVYFDENGIKRYSTPGENQFFPARHFDLYIDSRINGAGNRLKSAFKDFIYEGDEPATYHGDKPYRFNLEEYDLSGEQIDQIDRGEDDDDDSASFTYIGIFADPDCSRWSCAGLVLRELFTEWEPSRVRTLIGERDNTYGEWVNRSWHRGIYGIWTNKDRTKFEVEIPRRNNRFSLLPEDSARLIVGLNLYCKEYNILQSLIGEVLKCSNPKESEIRELVDPYIRIEGSK